MREHAVIECAKAAISDGTLNTCANLKTPHEYSLAVNMMLSRVQYLSSVLYLHSDVLAETLRSSIRHLLDSETLEAVRPHEIGPEALMVACTTRKLFGFRASFPVDSLGIELYAREMRSVATKWFDKHFVQLQDLSYPARVRACLAALPELRTAADALKLREVLPDVQDPALVAIAPHLVAMAPAFCYFEAAEIADETRKALRAIARNIDAVTPLFKAVHKFSEDLHGSLVYVGPDESYIDPDCPELDAWSPYSPHFLVRRFFITFGIGESSRRSAQLRRAVADSADVSSATALLNVIFGTPEENAPDVVPGRDALSIVIQMRLPRALGGYGLDQGSLQRRAHPFFERLHDEVRSSGWAAALYALLSPRTSWLLPHQSLWLDADDDLVEEEPTEGPTSDKFKVAGDHDDEPRTYFRHAGWSLCTAELNGNRFQCSLTQYRMLEKLASEPCKESALASDPAKKAALYDLVARSDGLVRFATLDGSRYFALDTSTEIKNMPSFALARLASLDVPVDEY